jgi:hypothetical protein
MSYPPDPKDFPVNDCCLDGTEFWNNHSAWVFPHDPLYYFSIEDNGCRWGFDIRQFYKLMVVASELKTVPKNPYTNTIFKIEILQQYNKAVAALKSAGLPITEKPAEISPERQVEFDIIDLFHKIDLKTHLISDTQWLTGRTTDQLIHLYTQFFRLWHYEIGWREKSPYKHQLIFGKSPIALISEYRSVRADPVRLRDFRTQLLTIIVDEIASIVAVDLELDQTLTLIIYLALADDF